MAPSISFKVDISILVHSFTKTLTNKNQNKVIASVAKQSPTHRIWDKIASSLSLLAMTEWCRYQAITR